MSLRIDLARLRRWAEHTAKRAREAAPDPESAERVGRALEDTERAARDVEARGRELAEDSG